MTGVVNRLMTEIRWHDMKVLVGYEVIFTGTPYSPVQVDWSKYSV